VSNASRVAVVATVLNERESLDAWLDGLATQIQRPDEIVIVDGGSHDGTWERLQVWAERMPLVLLRAEGATISCGRNLAIARTTCDIIAVTDAGTRAGSDWLAELCKPFASDAVDVVAGFFVPRLTSRWERALAATTLPDVTEVDPKTFLPSSRSVAFRRTWFEAGVCYPEWLDYCEDVVWDLSLRRAGARVVFAPAAAVEFRVRPTLLAFARQYFFYARGDGKAGLFARRHAIRYTAYGVLLVGVLRGRPVELSVLAAAGLAYIAPAARRLRWRDRVARRHVVEMLLLVPLVAALRAAGDAAKMAGYPCGLWWRWRRFGGLGWQTSWRRVSPSGRLWCSGRLSTRSRQPTSRPAGGSRSDLR
jgi:GT2 family glycosyltransferase